jgi:hypothetical protein
MTSSQLTADTLFDENLNISLNFHDPASWPCMNSIDIAWNVVLTRVKMDTAFFVG